MTDFKAGDKVVPNFKRGWWTEGGVYTVSADGVRDNDGDYWPMPEFGDHFTPALDADGWYPMPKLKAGDPIPEWLVDPETEYRSKLQWPLKPISVYVSIGRFLDGTITHYRPAPQTVTATTADGKEYRITHNPDGSVKAEVV